MEGNGMWGAEQEKLKLVNDRDQVRDGGEHKDLRNPVKVAVRMCVERVAVRLIETMSIKTKDGKKT